MAAKPTRDGAIREERDWARGSSPRKQVTEPRTKTSGETSGTATAEPKQSEKEKWTGNNEAWGAHLPRIRRTEGEPKSVVAPPKSTSEKRNLAAKFGAGKLRSAMKNSKDESSSTGDSGAHRRTGLAPDEKKWNTKPDQLRDEEIEVGRLNLTRRSLARGSRKPNHLQVKNWEPGLGPVVAVNRE
jgi:hypothetical protein